MAVPSVLIGCLPTYAQAGIAAPVLLSLLRLVQGLAMGGEFGSALVSEPVKEGKRGRGTGAATVLERQQGGGVPNYSATVGSPIIRILTTRFDHLLLHQIHHNMVS